MPRLSRVSAIRHQRWHHASEAMGDPGLLQEVPRIPALLAQGGGDREQPTAADQEALHQGLRNVKLTPKIRSGQIPQCRRQPSLPPSAS